MTNTNNNNNDNTNNVTNKNVYSIETNKNVKYVINTTSQKMRRWENIYNKETKEFEEINTDTFDFYFDVSLLVSEVDNTKYTKVILYKDKKVIEEHLNESKDSSNQLIKVLINNFCYLDESKKYIKDDMKNLYQKLRESKSKLNEVETLYVNGWNLQNKSYVKNSLSLFESNVTDGDEFLDVIKYFLENDESVVISTVDKIFNLIPFNTMPFVRNIYGVKDSGKTTCDLISQSLLKFPEVLNYITPASLEDIRSRTKNYIITFDETHLKGQNAELIYNLANDMIDQKMKRGNGVSWESSKRTSSFITATLIGETQYITTFGGENDRIYPYEKHVKTFDNIDEKSEYEIMLNKFYILSKTNYGIFFDSIIKYLETNFDDIKNMFITLNGNRREKTIKVYEYAFSLAKDYFLTNHNINLYDISNHITTYKEIHSSNEDEMKESVIIKLEEIIRKFKNKYIEVRNKSSIYETIGFVKNVKNEEVIFIYRNNKNIDILCKSFNIEETKLRGLFSDTFNKKSSSIDFNNKTQSVFKFSESDINALKSDNKDNIDNNEVYNVVKEITYDDILNNVNEEKETIISGIDGEALY